MSNSTFRNEFYRNTKQGITASVRNSNTATNLNASTTFAQIPINGLSDRMDSGFVLSGNGIQVLEAGWINLSGGIYVTCSVTAMAIEFAFAVNGVVRPVVRSAKVDDVGTMLFAQGEISDGFTVAANDVITMFSRRATGGAAGTATMVSGGCNMKISKDAVVGVAALASDMFKLVNQATLNRSSNTVFTNITDLGLNCVVGRRYAVRYQIRYQSVATATGIVLAFLNQGGLAGQLVANVRVNTTGTAGSLFTTNAFNTALTSTATPVANVPMLVDVDVNFVCTTAGVLMPQFRSEINASQVTVLPYSIAEIREIA